MDVYLNDWSLYSDRDILDNWSVVTDFNTLLGKLAKVNNLQFYAPQNFWSTPISGFNVMASTRSDNSCIPKEYSILLKVIYSKFRMIKDELPHFAEDEKMTTPSSTIGLAAEQSAPVISFIFDKRYKADSLVGWLKCEDGGVEKAEVNNIFEDKSSNYQLIADLTSCRKLNPLEKPMWNTELTEKLLEEVDFIRLDSKKRQGLLYKYGKIVAEMNGWTYNEKVSKLNSNAGQLRYIFDSSLSFPNYSIAYLCIDMEGPDLAFELCDKKGRHQGECSWKGARKEPQKNHDIKVK